MYNQHTLFLSKLKDCIMPLFSRLKNVYVLALVIVSSVACNSQTNIPTGGTQNVSIDYKKLSNIDTLVDGYIHRDWIKGAVTIIVKDGEVLQYKGYGYSAAASKKIMETNIIISIASQPKPIVI